VDDLRAHYHQVIYATGAQTDLSMRIPGEDLKGSHAATEFVAWYNGHPDFADREFDLSAERVVVVGMGNVAIDVARILCRTPEELHLSDIADHAIETLSSSGVREVQLLGRRGPAQAAFTNPELKELLHLEGAEVCAFPDELRLDSGSRQAVEQSGDRALLKRLEMLAQLPEPVGEPSVGRKRLVLRFLVSPEELAPGSDGRVGQLRLGRNELVGGPDGSLRARPTGETEELSAGLVFRSVGYRGIPLPGLPFDERRAIVPNDGGRVLHPDPPGAAPGLYVSGWIKRGPSGVIGTNKPCAGETVAKMLEDLGRGACGEPEPAGGLESLLDRRELRPLSYADWTTLDRLETEGGAANGRPRRKFVRREDCLRVLDP
jgi:ferredoxin--NADP+ reductase